MSVQVLSPGIGPREVKHRLFGCRHQALAELCGHCHGVELGDLAHDEPDLAVAISQSKCSALGGDGDVADTDRTGEGPMHARSGEPRQDRHLVAVQSGRDRSSRSLDRRAPCGAHVLSRHSAVDAMGEPVSDPASQQDRQLWARMGVEIGEVGRADCPHRRTREALESLSFGVHYANFSRCD